MNAAVFFPLTRITYDTDRAVEVGDFLYVRHRRTGKICSVYHVVKATETLARADTGYPKRFRLRCERWNDPMPTFARQLPLVWNSRKRKVPH